MKNLVTLGNVLGKVLSVSILFVILFFASCAKDPLPTPTPPPPTVVKTAPGAPSIIEVTVVTAGTVAVAITPPTSDGNSAITGYTVTSNPDNISVNGTINGENNKITVSGLKDNGTEYSFDVKAVNAIGSSASSASSSKVVPADARTNFLMYSKGWKLVGLESLAASENKWISYILNECQKDDINIFKANGKGLFFHGPQKCSDTPDGGLTWAFNADKTKMAWNGTEMLLTIDVLNEDTLSIISDGVNLNTGAPVKFKRTYKHW